MDKVSPGDVEMVGNSALTEAFDKLRMGAVAQPSTQAAVIFGSIRQVSVDGIRLKALRPCVKGADWVLSGADYI